MKCRKNDGFTLIEILVTIAIIGILSSIFLESFKSTKEKARIAITESDLRNIETGIALLSNDTGEWPGHAGVEQVSASGPGIEIWDLSSQAAGLIQEDGLFPAWNGPYIKAASTTDPWGNEYFFDSYYNIGTSSDIWVAVIGSFGPDGLSTHDALQSVANNQDNIFRVLAATST